MSFSYEQLLTTADLAGVLRKSVHSVRHDLTRNPCSLPPRCVIPGAKRNLWRLQDVEAWLASHVEHTPPVPEVALLPARRRGRPTKMEQAARASNNNGEAHVPSQPI